MLIYSSFYFKKSSYLVSIYLDWYTYHQNMFIVISYIMFLPGIWPHSYVQLAKHICPMWENRMTQPCFIGPRVVIMWALAAKFVRIHFYVFLPCFHFPSSIIQRVQVKYVGIKNTRDPKNKKSTRNRCAKFRGKTFFWGGLPNLETNPFEDI